MIKIINTNNSVTNKNDVEWKRANCSSLVDRLSINQPCKTSQSDIDAIANEMDKIETVNDQECKEFQNMPSHNISKEEVAKMMIDNYIRNNGGIPYDQNNNSNKVSNQHTNKILLG